MENRLKQEKYMSELHNKLNNLTDKRNYIQSDSDEVSNENMDEIYKICLCNNCRPDRIQSLDSNAYYSYISMTNHKASYNDTIYKYYRFFYFAALLSLIIYMGFFLFMLVNNENY